MSRLLTVMLIHTSPEDVAARVALLERRVPDARLVVAYGGPREAFAAIDHPDKVFVEDPLLRSTSHTIKSITSLLAVVRDRFMADDDTLGSLYLIEWDHLVLRADHEQALLGLAERTGAGFLGKYAMRRTGTNWFHVLRWRHDETLLAHLRRHSVRDEPDVLYGALGDGFWITREALDAFLAVPDEPPCYFEVLLPTLVHHLGFKVVDVDAHGDLYRHVRFQPVLELDEVLRLDRAGATYLHPVKDPAAVAALSAAEPDPASQTAFR